MSCLGCEVRDADMQALRIRFDSILGREIEQRRREQDEQWGGPEHDDTHVQHEWIDIMRKFTDRAASAANIWAYEDNLLDVCATALAAIQSGRRKRGAA